MQNSPGLRYLPWFTAALLLGSLCGWSIGNELGLNGNQWFAEPELLFEVLVGLSGALCGALLAYASERGLAWRLAGVLAGTCFIVAVLAYCHHSLGVPAADMSLLTYARQFILKTFGIWFSPVFGAALVALLRVILR
ncbi:hypothetical protein [Pseudomonas nitroreducens]|uniref:hypothetical protein n=1 Tax=Pseudomonas nitroreducens TaxID=46680 RepID=UPI00209F74B7|nr:hypothetical protein [Pseudomonas nitroreducens]MCP1625902.1 hypothetical protein [Pseudomonas nitroreducens]